MSNILSEVHPELVAEWSDKNLPLTPDRITYGSNKVVWWKGACGHEWQTSVKARSNGENCPICSGARVIEGINDLATLKPELADEWSSKNDPLKPTMVTTGSQALRTLVLMNSPMITFNALTAADSVIIPVQAQYLPAKGMTQLLGTIAKVRKHTNADLKIDGILLTLVDGRTNLAKSTVEALRENFGSHIRIYRSMIPAAVKAAEVSSKGTSIYAYEPNSPVSKAYAGFTKEVLADGRQKERLHAAHEHAR